MQSERSSSFDDRHLYSTDANALHQAMELMVNSFECMDSKLTQPRQRQWCVLLIQPPQDYVPLHTSIEWAISQKTPTVHGRDNKSNVTFAILMYKHGVSLNTNERNMELTQHAQLTKQPHLPFQKLRIDMD
jgi:hypothetical protein